MRQPPDEERRRGLTDDWSSAKLFLPHRMEMGLPSDNTCRGRKAHLKGWRGHGPVVLIRPDLHGVVFTVPALLEVQVQEADGDEVAFPGTSAPVQSGVRQVSVGIPRRLHPPQQHGRGPGAEQRKQKT